MVGTSPARRRCAPSPGMLPARPSHTALPSRPLSAAGFYAAVRDFVWIIVIAAPLFALTDYVDSCLTVAWRQWLTRHMIRRAGGGGPWAAGLVIAAWRKLHAGGPPATPKSRRHAPRQLAL